MNTWSKYITAFFLFFLPGFFVLSQVNVKASIDSNRILIGEPIHLTLEAYVPLGAEIKWFVPDTFPYFDWISKGKIDTVESLEAKKLTQVLTITSFDSGRWEIPAFTLEVEQKAYFTDPISVYVAFSEFDPLADYRDIKDIEEVINPYTKYIPWIISIVTLISGLLIFYFLKRKRPQVKKDRKIESRLSPYEEAMQALAELRRSGIPENGEAKEYYTKLNDILRQFVFRKLNISTREKTNDEMILHLKEMQLSKENFFSLSQALRMADFVKFAKYKPQQDDNEKNLSVIQSSIQILNKIQ